MVDRRQLVLGMLVVFTVFVVYTFFNSARVTGNIAVGGLAGALWYLLSDFKNWLIVGGFFFLPVGSGLSWQKFLPGIFVALAADIVSYPRLLPTPPLAGEAIRASLDWIVVSAMPFSYGVSYQFYYFALPLLLMFAAAYALGLRGFAKRVGW